MKGLGLIAPIASGKDTVAEILTRMSVEKRLVVSKHFSTSEKISRVAAEFGIFAADRFKKQEIGMIIDRANGHNNGMVDALWPEVKKSGVHLAIINSIRLEQQAHRWLELLPGFQFLYIDVDDHVRWQRNNERRRKLRLPPITEKEFNQEHAAEADNNLQRLKKYADLRVNNNGSEDELRLRLLEILIELFPYEKPWSYR